LYLLYGLLLARKQKCFWVSESEAKFHDHNSVNNLFGKFSAWVKKLSRFTNEKYFSNFQTTPTSTFSL